jgi:hypothetical protein
LTEALKDGVGIDIVNSTGDQFSLLWEWEDRAHLIVEHEVLGALAVSR